MTDHLGMKLVDVYASVLQGFNYQPTVHVHYGNKMVAMKDGLPRFRDLPAEFGAPEKYCPTNRTGASTTLSIRPVRRNRDHHD